MKHRPLNYVNPVTQERREIFTKHLGQDECRLQFKLWADGTRLNVSGFWLDSDPIYRPAICAWEAWKAAWELRK
jgi:hypothetical protein